MFTALTARREALRDRDGGFTLIELLVVVIIIGILAAIAIPIYIGVQTNAKDAAAQSDLVNAKTALVASYSATGAYPAVSALGPYGYTVPAGGPAVSDDSASAGTISAFCLTETSSSGTAFYITQSIAPTSTKPVSCT